MKMEAQIAIIKLTAKIFDENQIEYHFDASTTAMVHGFTFNMTDIDVVLKLEKLDLVRHILANDFELDDTEYMSSKKLFHFFAHKDDEKLHCIFYEESEVSNFDDEVILINMNGQKIKAKSMNYFIRKKKMQYHIGKINDR